MVNNYTIVDDMKIINYIISNKLYTQVKGRRMWQEMAAAGILDRSWHSLKQRYIYKIITCLNNYNIPIIERTRLSSGYRTPVSKTTTSKYFSDSSNDSNSESTITTLETRLHSESFSTRKNFDAPADMVQIKMSDDSEVESDRLNESPVSMCKKKKIQMILATDEEDCVLVNDNTAEHPEDDKTIVNLTSDSNTGDCVNSPEGSGGALDETLVEPPRQPNQPPGQPNQPPGQPNQPPGQPDRSPNYMIKYIVDDRTILFVPGSISNRDLRQIRHRYTHDIVLLNAKDYNIAFVRKWYNAYFSKVLNENHNNLINKYVPQEQAASADPCEVSKQVIVDAHNNLAAGLLLASLNGEASPQPAHSSSPSPAPSVLQLEAPAPTTVTATAQADDSSDEDLFPEYKLSQSAEETELKAPPPAGPQGPAELSQDSSQELLVNKRSTKHIRVYSKRRCDSAGGSSAAPPNGPGGSPASRAAPPEQIDLCDDSVIKKEVDVDQTLSLEPEGPGGSSYLSHSSLTSCETFYSAVAQSQESTTSQRMASHSPESAQSALQLLQGLRSADPGSQ